MEDSDSSDFSEEETKKEVDIHYCLETWRCSSTVEWSFLDLEPISEAEQSSFCVELMKRLNMQRQQSYFCNITLVAKEGYGAPFVSKLIFSLVINFSSFSVLNHGF